MEVEQIGQIILAVFGGFALLATQVPNVAKNPVVQFILSLVNFLGANWGKSKNAE